MVTQTASKGVSPGEDEMLPRPRWIRIGLATALAATVLVLAAQSVALAYWPELASFKPLENYGRSTVFTLVPALLATALFARLVRSSKKPVASFLKIAFIALLLSFIPDYVLPDPNKSFLASSVAAFLHLVAAIVITGGIIAGYVRAIQKS